MIPQKKYKEVFISLGGVQAKVYRTEVSLEEYLTYTTEQSETVQLQKYMVKYNGDLPKAIKAMAIDLRESGIKNSNLQHEKAS